MCSSDTQEIDEYAVDEVVDAYSPRESEDGMHTLIHVIQLKMSIDYVEVKNTKIMLNNNYSPT